MDINKYREKHKDSLVDEPQPVVPSITTVPASAPSTVPAVIVPPAPAIVVPGSTVIPGDHVTKGSATLGSHVTFYKGYQIHFALATGNWWVNNTSGGLMAFCKSYKECTDYIDHMVARKK